jgi:hypothetical protein
MVQYVVSSVKELQVIREHSEKYTLLTKKCGDFELWKKALDIYKNKEHLTEQGLQKIVAIRGTINRGLTDSLKAAFPNPKGVLFFIYIKKIRLFQLKFLTLIILQ